MDIPAVITVRTSSTRLPGKCLMPFGDGNVLQHIIRRARHFDLKPIVCTSTDPSDDIIESLALSEGAACFRGSLINKLKRWGDCAAQFGLASFHTVDADDPFFDGEEIRNSMDLLSKSGADVIYPTASSSAGGASVGYSLTAEVVRRALVGLPEEADTEMMWYRLESIPDLRSLALPDATPFELKVRLTLDYPEDYWLLESVRRMVGNLASRQEINRLFASNPDLYKVNWFRNEEWKQGQLAKKK